MKFSAGTQVRVINVRSLAYGRVGVITAGKGKDKAIVRFSDVPKLDPTELQNPTGLVASFYHSELTEIQPGQLPRQIDQKLLDELAELLTDLHFDAEMALSDDWERSDNGFQCQIDNIESFFPKVFGLDVKQHPAYGRSL